MNSFATDEGERGNTSILPCTHVLFVHGVGRHSKLSSLLRAYQSLRANVLSAEAPIEREDVFPGATLCSFDDSNLACIKLERWNSAAGSVEEVFLYEVNYSALAGVIRENHRLDIADLFVGLDLAVNVSRNRLIKFEEAQPIDLELAKIAQKVAGVLVAGTVPILGLPSLMFQKYIGTFVADFTRFFEDVATFALDRNGETLISAHMDHTVDSILSELKRSKSSNTPNEFVIVAHSLGSVVAHSFLVRNWADGKIPNKVFTLGSPIGLVSWLWRFLDFKGLQFASNNWNRDNYFCWRPLEAPSGEGKKREIEWINVVNHLDPIATAFPLSDIYLGEGEEKISARLKNGKVRQHFIKKIGGFYSVGSAHTEYFDDRHNFLKLLGKTISLSDAQPPSSRDPDKHWREVGEDLFLWQIILWGFGVAFIYCYFVMLSHYLGRLIPWGFMALYIFPPLTIGGLAFFQRLLLGGPTKRTRADEIKALPFADPISFPYHLRQIFCGRHDPSPEACRPNPVIKHFLQAVSFLPTLVAMVMPIWLAEAFDGTDHGLYQIISEPYNLIMKTGVKSLAFLVVFMVYTMAFAGSEFARHWRAALKELVCAKSK